MTATDSYFPDEYEFTDDVLGRVHLNQLERDCVDTPEYRRLFRVSQLGLVDRLYHTANHTRGIHSIGVCYHAKQLVDHLNSNTPRVAAARGRRRDLPTSTLPTITHAERCLISLAGLLHDLPHGPLSHDIEKKTHRYGDGNDTRLRSCYGPYPKHDDCENNPALYVILFDTQRSVLARVLEHHSPNFWQQLRADALMHEHLKSFVDLVPKCHWKGYERALLPTLLFHLLLFEDIDTAKSHTQLMVMKDFEDKPQYWGLGPKDHWAPLHKAWYQPYRHDIVGNTLSADLLDYLARDAKRLGIRTPFDVKLLEVLCSRQRRSDGHLTQSCHRSRALCH